MPLSGAERARRHREKLKQNPALYSEYLRKEHERYERRKEEGSIKLVHDMTNREKRHARKSWRQRKQRQKEKQTSLNRHLNDTPPPTPNTSVSDEYRRMSATVTILSTIHVSQRRRYLDPLLQVLTS
jgi:hypothetical protein